MNDQLRRRILPILAVVVTLASCGRGVGVPDPEAPELVLIDPVPHPGEPPDHATAPSRWTPWAEPDVSHLIRTEPPTAPPPPPPPPPPQERPDPVPKPDDHPAEIYGSYAAWPGSSEPVIDWEACCTEPEAPGAPEDPPDEDPPQEEPPQTEDPDIRGILGLYWIGNGTWTTKHGETPYVVFAWTEPIITAPPCTRSGTCFGWTQTAVKTYHYTFDGTPGTVGRHNIRFENLAPRSWHDFTVYAEFVDGTTGPGASIRGQATGAPPPCTNPGGCR